MPPWRNSARRHLTNPRCNRRVELRIATSLASIASPAAELGVRWRFTIRPTMSELANLDPFKLPLRDRVRRGLRRGALVGVYVYAVLWFLLLIRVRGAHRPR